MPIKKGRNLDTCQKIAEAYEKSQEPNKTKTQIAKEMFVSVPYITTLLSNNLLAERLYISYATGKLEGEYKKIQDDVSLSIAIDPSLNMSSGKAKKAKKAALHAKKQDHSAKLIKKFSFLTNEESKAWFSAIESGLSSNMAADCAKIDRDKPTEWIEKALAGEEEYLDWLKSTREVSAMSYKSILDDIRTGSSIWRAADMALSRFEKFDDSTEKDNSADQLRVILDAALGNDNKSKTARS